MEILRFAICSCEVGNYGRRLFISLGRIGEMRRRKKDLASCVLKESFLGLLIFKRITMKC